MKSNSKLKIVWMVCGVAIVLLFCTQAYWLHLQCQYSLDQQVEQFKKDCDEVLAQDLKNRKKLQENSSTKGRRDTVMLKIESEYDMKKGCSRTTLSFWNNHRFLVRLNDPNLTGDDAYLIISRYLANIGKHPSLASYQLPHHGFERSSNRNGHLKRNTLAKHWVRLILYRHHT